MSDPVEFPQKFFYSMTLKIIEMCVLWFLQH